MEENKRKPLLGSFEFFLLILGIGVIGYVFLKKNGFSFIEKTETVIVVDHPKDYSNQRKPVSYEKEENMTDLEDVLKELTTGSSSSGKASKSDIDFYRKAKENYQANSELQSVGWMKYLSSSYSVYNKVRSMVSNDDRSQMEILAGDFKQMIDNPEMTSKLVEGLQSLYNISSTDTKSFLSSEENMDAVKLVDFIKSKSANVK